MHEEPGKPQPDEQCAGADQVHAALENPRPEQQACQRVSDCGLSGDDGVDQHGCLQRQVLQAIGMGTHQALAKGAGRIAAIGGEDIDLQSPGQHQQAALVHQQEHQ
ncbi:hypothetical protein D3C78_1528240 [compost metagenome]